MIRSRFGLLGLCAVLFGVMAFGAASAQASGTWQLAEKAPNSGLITFLSAEVGLETDVPGVLHSKIIGIAVLFECSTISAVNAKLLASGSIGESEGNVKGSKVKFSGCITKLNGTTSPECEPKAGGVNGVIVTNPGHGLLELHETATGSKIDIVRLLPDTGETFATIEMGAECPIGTKVPVIGKLTLIDCEGKFLEHLVRHLVEAGPLTELWTISKTTEHVASLLGSAWAFLTGIHEGYKFSGNPE